MRWPFVFEDPANAARIAHDGELLRMSAEIADLTKQRDDALAATAALNERYNRLGAELVAKGRDYETERAATINARAVRDVWKARAERAESAHDALMEKYHELRTVGANPLQPTPVFTVPPGPLDSLGPLTRAALAEMGSGLSSPSKRAMEGRTLTLSATITDDAALADRVRRGEKPRTINIG